MGVNKKKPIKRKDKGEIDYIGFDEDARREFVTGFHKRKLDKKNKAREKAAKEYKEALLEARRDKKVKLPIEDTLRIDAIGKDIPVMYVSPSLNGMETISITNPSAVKEDDEEFDEPNDKEDEASESNDMDNDAESEMQITADKNVPQETNTTKNPKPKKKNPNDFLKSRSKKVVKSGKFKGNIKKR